MKKTFYKVALGITAPAFVFVLPLSSPVMGESIARLLVKQPELSATFLDRYGNEVGKRSSKDRGVRASDQSLGYYLDASFDELMKLVDTLSRGGKQQKFIVRTALDPDLQRAAHAAIEKSLHRYGDQYQVKQAAVVVADLHGGVRAMVGGRDYGVSQFNRATHARRLPGYSFSPYVYATALSKGLEPSSTIDDAPFCLGNWCPQNADRTFVGTVTLTEALAKSIRTVPLRLSVMLGQGDAKAGRAEIIRTVQTLGIELRAPDTPSLPLGSREVSMLEHVVAYATFPNEGRTASPHTMLEVRTGDGKPVWRFDRDGKKPEQALSQQVALKMTMMMNSAVENGSGKPAKLDSVAVAGADTVDASRDGLGNRDAWFVGFTGNFVCGVWTGNDDQSSMKPMAAGSLPAMIWHDVMTSAHTDIALKSAPGLPSKQ